MDHSMHHPIMVLLYNELIVQNTDDGVVRVKFYCDIHTHHLKRCKLHIRRVGNLNWCEISYVNNDIDVIIARYGRDSDGYQHGCCNHHFSIYNFNPQDIIDLIAGEFL